MRQKTCNILLAIAFAMGNDVYAADPPPQDLKEEIATLKIQLLNLKEEIDEYHKNERELLGDLMESHHKTATFDVSSIDSFAPVDSSIGTLLITLKGVEPYLDGYRVRLEIGNPHAAQITNYSLDLLWGGRISEDPTNISKRKHRKYKGNTPLNAGRWKTVSLILPSTTAAQMGELEISISVDRVDMPKESAQ